MSNNFARLVGGLTTIGIVNIALATMTSDGLASSTVDPRTEVAIALLLDDIASLQEALATTRQEFNGVPAAVPANAAGSCQQHARLYRENGRCGTALRGGCLIAAVEEQWE